MSLYKPFKAGKLALPGNLLGAPIAGYSDAAFRAVCLAGGADLCFTEMVSAEALDRGSAKTRELLARAEGESMLAPQLFGGKPEVLARALALILPAEPSIVDLNCGCPVPKIIKAGAGSALMRDPSRVAAIFRAMRAEAGDVPLSAKIRLGWDGATMNFLDVADAACSEGASMVTLHSRTKAQGYAGKADWAALKELAVFLRAKHPGVAVVGSGDLFGPLAARAMIEATGCDAVMYARGAVGDPFVFGQARAVLEGRDPAPVPPEARVEAARRQLRLSVGIYGERGACSLMRKHVAAYTKGLPGGAELRREAVSSSSVADYERVFEKLLLRERERGAGEKRDEDDVGDFEQGE